jgi:segregation and condensation protein B
MPDQFTSLNELRLDVRIEGILFYKAEPLKKHTLATFFDVPLDELETALTHLRERLTGGATRLTMTDTMVQLVSAPELSETIEKLKKEELRSDIGKAGAETLAIVLYRGPLSRAEIDRIRGVNSTFILRNLLIRGLVERREHPSDARSFTYAVTPTLLNHLGINRREEMPEFQTIMDALDTFEREEIAREVSPVLQTEV